MNNFFDFKITPFQRDTPSGAMYITPALESLHARLKYGINNQFFMTLTGDTGVGKTAAIRRLVMSLDPADTLALYVADSNLTARNFYFDVLNKLGAEPRHYNNDSKRQFVKELTAVAESGKKIVLIVDEAHLCKMEMLTEVRFLLNYNFDCKCPMSLILVGQTSLRVTLGLQAYEPILQRVDLRCHIMPLNLTQTSEYINTQLSFAASTSAAQIFTESAIVAVHEFAKGIPRKINKVASTCLLHAATSKTSLVDDNMVKLIVKSELA